jgi:acyl-CoA thioesterase-2
MRLLGTAILPHPIALTSKDLLIASIDHAMWFHSSNINVNEWMLYITESPWAGAGRGFANARIYSESGELLASVAQEGIIRSRK